MPFVARGTRASAPACFRASRAKTASSLTWVSTRARKGWQSFEATDFLAARRRFDPTSALILWQVGLLGEASVGSGVCRRDRLRVLTKVLRGHYPARHHVVLYQAAQFPLCEPIIESVALAKLPEMAVSIPTTLYVPPRPSRAQDSRIMRWLDEP